MRSYGGIGSRRSPPEVLELMTGLAYRLSEQGWTLRTGGAQGADQAFYEGAAQGGGDIELFLPWPTFEHEHRARWGQPTLLFPRPDRAAYEVTAPFHPGWAGLKDSVRALMARNAHQVLGATLRDPVRFVLCWTPDGSLDGKGRDSGGTGQALRIAAAHGVSVFNLARSEHRARVEAMEAA